MYSFYSNRRTAFNLRMYLCIGPLNRPLLKFCISPHVLIGAGVADVSMRHLLNQSTRFVAA